MNITASFTTFDYVLSVIILIFAIAGLIKGFVDNIFGKLALVFGIIAGVYFYDKVAERLWSSVGHKMVSNVLGFLTVFVVVFLFIKLIQIIFSKLFSFSVLKSLDKTLGFFFGIVEGYAVVALIIFVLNIQPFFPANRLLEGSFYSKLTNQVIDTIQPVLPKTLDDTSTGDGSTGGEHV